MITAISSIAINIPYITTIIALFACIYASFSDLKWGIIPNKLTFPLIGVGLVLNVIYAFFLGDIGFFILTIVIVPAIFVLGYLFWKMGAWAGGDVKLFTALAALLPVYPLLFVYRPFNLLPVLALYPFPLTIIIDSILSMLPFLLIYVLYVVVKHKPYLIDELIAPIKEYRKNIVLSLAVTSAGSLTVLITPYIHLQIVIISLILIYLLSLIISKLPNLLKAAVISVVTVYALVKNLELTLIAVIGLFISFTLVGILRKLLTSVNREALQDDYRINELDEGMIPAFNLYEKEDEVYFDDKGFLDKFSQAIKTGDLSLLNAPSGKLLVSKMAAGLNKENIELLEKLLREGKIEDKYRIRKGVPFAPSILIGLLISLFIGDLAFIFVKVLNWLLH